jgi:hypothetical protein
MVKHKLAAVALATALVGGLTSPAWGDPGVGQPTEPSCFGQNASGFAQQYGGIPNAVDTFGLTVQEGRSVLRGGCGRTSGL